MKELEYKGLDIKVFHEKLENGLDIYLIPFDNRNNYYVEYGVKYGANVNEFLSKKTNKKVKMPYGIAHFLEHKMFEQEDDIDPFAFYSESGTDANASTSYEMTSYTIEGTKDIEKNINFLLDYVNSPYFTDENVEKEKGIIIEELNMYKDQPENAIYVQSNKSLFKKHPMREDIGGSPKSVNKITKEMLYECYETFYQPNNMFLVVAGKFDKDKIIKIIKNNKKLNSKKYSEKPVIYKINEQVQVNRKEKEIKVNNIIIPKFIYSFKSPLKELSNLEKYKYITSANILLYILYGPSSDFRDEMFRNNFCYSFYSSCEMVDNLLMIEFIAETKKPYELKKKTIDCFKNKIITKDDVERVKKVKISHEVMDSDKPHRILNSLVMQLNDYDEPIYNKLDIIRSISYEDVIKIKDDILIDNSSFVLGLPKKEKKL